MTRSMTEELHAISHPRPLVRASSSPYRSQLLERLGLPFTVAAPEYEEEHDLVLPPDELVMELARRKARSLTARFPDALIIGSDQVAELDGSILLKPGSEDRARAQLSRLAGRTHRLLTGLVVHDSASDRVEQALDVHRMTIRPLTLDHIAAYVAQEQPLDCAGSYRVEGTGIALFTSMEGEDFTGIIGLPLTKLVTLLQRF